MKLIRRLYFPLFVLVLTVAVTSCDDDDKLPKAQTEITGQDNTNNTNRNPVGSNPEYGRLEFPHISNDPTSVVLIRRTPEFGINYTIEYDTKKRSQRWTCWQWYKGNSGTAWSRNNWDYETDNKWAMLNMATHGWGDPFQPDPDLSVGVRTELEEYNNIAFQRGHICASADRLNSKDANEQTFYLSNIMPQSAALNTGIWQEMENKVQSWGKDNSFRRVLYVVKGGTIDDANIRTITPTGLVVPKYFFMALLCEDNSGEYKALAFWVEHTTQNMKGTPLGNFVINIRELERRTGIDFFCNLPDEKENEVETASVSNIKSAWKL